MYFSLAIAHQKAFIFELLKRVRLAKLLRTRLETVLVDNCIALIEDATTLHSIRLWRLMNSFYT